MAQKNSLITTIAIMSIFFIAMGVGTITPALNSIMLAFPDLSVSTIYLTSTLPSLMCIPATLFAGAVAGNRVKFKTLGIIGVGLFVLGGVAPFFATDFTVILIERAIFGIGLGIISPIGNALIIGLYEGEQQANLLGIGTIMMNVGGIVLQFMGGAMAGVAWNYAFLPHLLGIITLLLVMFFLPEPPKIEHPAGAEKPKITIKPVIWLVAALFGVVMFIDYPMLMGMSTFLANNKIGGPTTAAVVLSFFTVGGMIGGAVFSSVFKFAKRFTVGIGLLCMSIAYVFVLYTGNVALITVGAAFEGIGFSILMPSVFTIVGMTASPQSVPMCASIILAVMNAFAFVTTYWIAFIGGVTGDPVGGPMFAGMIIAAIGGVIFLVVDPFPKPKND